MLARARLLVVAIFCVAAATTTLTSATAHAGWAKSKSVVPGLYADAEVFRLPDGRYRMLYGTSEEVPAEDFGIYSSVSGDGKTWQSEGRVLTGRFSGPDVVVLPGGGYRLYLNGPLTTATESGMIPLAGLISYTSADGATWQREPGVRLPDSWLAPGDRFGFSSTTRLADGTWLMAYTIDRSGSHGRDIPPGLATIWWATSPDGLTFTRRRVAVNPKNRLLLGNARSPEFSGRHLYFHSLKGIFRVTWTGKGFTRRPTLEYGSCKEPEKVFPWTPPPADPTLARIGRTTVMFHGDHLRGIFRTEKRRGARACFAGIFQG